MGFPFVAGLFVEKVLLEEEEEEIEGDGDEEDDEDQEKVANEDKKNDGCNNGDIGNEMIYDSSHCRSIVTLPMELSIDHNRHQQVQKLLLQQEIPTQLEN